MKYELFLTHLTKRCLNMSFTLSKKGLHFNSFYTALPPHVFTPLWAPLIQMEGFYSALPHISNSITRFLMCVNKSKEDTQLAKRQHQHILSVICPLVLTYKSQNCSIQEIINRAKEMKKHWKLNSNICASLIVYIQCNEEKENDPESKKLKIINDLLVIFDTNESKLDYRYNALNILRQTVGEFVYSIKVWDQSYEEIYKRLCVSNRQKLIYLLSKIKKKESTFASVLEQIVSPKNNQTDVTRITNICTLFLLVQNWDKFKQADSRLKEPIVIQILGEAFERLFYLAYNEDFSIGMLLLNFLYCSKFTLYDQIKQAIAYHLLALYKFYLYSQKTAPAKLIEKIWSDKMKSVKLIQIFSEYAPSFVTKSQWTEDRALQEAQTRSINSKSSGSEILILKSNRTSKSKQGRATKGSNLLRRIKNIEQELRRCNFERVYLLMQSLKKFYWQFEDKIADVMARTSVISLIILLYKMMEAKIHFRYKCSMLKKAIYLEIMELKQKCFVDASFQYNEKNLSLGMFECCYIDKGEINFDSLIKFHEKNNYEDTLQTVYSLKLLYDDLNSNNLSGSRLESYEEQLSQFQSKVYLLYKNQLNQSKKIDAKRLVIICKLLLLKSNSVTNNLLVNYVFLILKQEKIPESILKKKIDAYSKLMNAQITQQNNDQRIRILLIMADIFEEFSEQSFKLMDSAPSNRYFQFLRRKEHAPYYYIYSQIYLKMNYLKESLYFLQLHHFSQSNPSIDAKKTAIQIYGRLNNPFKTYLKNILKELKIDDSGIQQQINHQKESMRFNFQIFVRKMRNQIENDTTLPNRYEQYNIKSQPRIQLWLNYYFRYLDFFIEELASHKEALEINERLRKYAIIVKYIQLKLDTSKKDLSTIIQLIQKLRNDDDRNHFYQYFLQILQNGKGKQEMEDIYLQHLLKCKKYEQMLAYLRRHLNPNDANTKMDLNYLRYLIKYHFERSQFDRCLSMITVLVDRRQKLANNNQPSTGQQNMTQIYHMELQSKYKLMLNYTIEEYISTINKALKFYINAMKQFKPKPKPTEKHFKYYFKIFRMLFDRYHFTNTNHNIIFLQVFFMFIQADDILTENIEYVGQSIHILLRFVAQKFDYSPNSTSKCFQKTILEQFKGKTQHFIPFCNYLIKRISLNQSKNQAIKTILKTILTQHPKECIWIIAFIKNFAYKANKGSKLTKEEHLEIEQFSELYKEIHETLLARKSINMDHLNWIDNLVLLSLSETDSKKQKCHGFKQIPVPSELPYMFNDRFYINRVQDIRVLSNGKSAPLEIIFNLIHTKEKYYLTVKVIIKGNTGVKKYRMESNIANFFEEIGLIDGDITYKIIHLSKCLITIQHRAHIGTVNSVVCENLPEFRKIQGLILSEIQKKKLHNIQDKRLLQIYDNNNKFQNRIRFSQVIYHKAKNIKDWWKKYNNFVRTHAQWSYLGYIVGLGDRHCDNILYTDEGKLIHIDFQYALDTGLKLPYPEWVPFRLTSCFIEPLGLLGVYGMYYAEMINTAKEFQEKQHNIWKALSNFVGSLDTNVCEQIIQRSKFLNLSVSSTEEGVAKLIASAKDPELLRLMFEGWRAYL